MHSFYWDTWTLNQVLTALSSLVVPGKRWTVILGEHPAERQISPASQQYPNTGILLLGCMVWFVLYIALDPQESVSIKNGHL